MTNPKISAGQTEILLRMGRERDSIPEDLLRLSEESLSDGIIDEQEALFLFKWLKKAEKNSDNLVTRILLHRVGDMLSDGELDDDERDELMFLLGTLHGETKESSLDGFSSNLPFCVPEPDVCFEGKGFCLTGQFAYGPRKKCESVIELLGGQIEKRINWRVDYLVVGTLCTMAWAHPTYGRKIEEAIAYRMRGKDLHIISENHWAQFSLNI